MDKSLSNDWQFEEVDTESSRRQAEYDADERDKALAITMELLEALEKAAGWMLYITDEVLDGENIRPKYVEDYAQIRAAIAKAKV